VAFTPEDLALLVNRDMVHGGTVATAAFSPAAAQAVAALSPGAFLAVTQLPAGAAEKVLTVVCWRGRGDGTINVMCSKEALHVVGHRLVDLGVEVTFPENIQKKPTNTDSGWPKEGAEVEGGEGATSAE
jgi:hypothetical protein